MFPRSAITLFCDDIREEHMGMITLVGVYPNNVNVPSFPFVLPKLGIYTRILIDVNDALRKITIHISAPDGKIELSTEIDEESIAKSQMAAKDKGSPIVGIMAHAIAAPFVVKEAGQIKLIVNIEGVEYIGGVLIFDQTP